MLGESPIWHTYRLKRKNIMASLAEIRAKLNKEDTQRENRGGGDKTVFPFWDSPDDKTSLIRFLPDGDEDNVYFWRERLVIRLPFQGIKGEHNNEVTVQVPCMEMYPGKKCPILAETRPWWKDEALKDKARKYWKKKSYLFQGFVVSSAFEEENPPENPIRRFTINSSIFDKIKASLMDDELEELPIDFERGRDFKLTKTKKGQWANYDTSAWSMKERALSDEERDAISEYGLNNLSEFLPKEPNEAELNAIMEMFEASVDDQPYDPEKWGEFYKPFGLNTSTSSTSGSTSSTSEDTTDEVQEEASKTDPKAILARIRSKQKN